MDREEQILNCSMPDTEEGLEGNQEEELVAMIEESPSDAGINSNQPGASAFCCFYF